MKKYSSIVLIDDGINEHSHLGHAPIQHLYVDSNGNVEEEKNVHLSLHGTRCANIIQSVSSNCRFISIRIFEENGKAPVEKLLVSLDWCMYSEARYINMSLGTIDYFEGELLKLPINKLLKREKVIVTAYNNFDIPSYPAVIPGVFAIRSNKTKKKLNCNIGFDSSMKEQCFNGLIVEEPFRKDVNQYNNSYAAAYFMGVIHKISSQNANERLFSMRNAIRQKYTEFINHPLYKFFPESNLQIDLPIVYIQIDGLINDIDKIIVKKGIKAVSFTDDLTDRVYPLDFFGIGIITSDFLVAMQRSFNPSIFLIERLHPSDGDYAADLYINSGDAESAVELIIQYFS